MNRKEVLENIGNVVKVNGNGDLYFDGYLREIIRSDVITLTIVKLTKGGMVHLSGSNGKFYTVPPKNVYKESVQTLELLKL